MIRCNNEEVIIVARSIRFRADGTWVRCRLVETGRIRWARTQYLTADGGAAEIEAARLAAPKTNLPIES